MNIHQKILTMIGVTGTNGKTSVSGIIHAYALRHRVKNRLLSGTIGFDLNGMLYESANTTSDALTTQANDLPCENEGCRTMIMEVSSHGLSIRAISRCGL